MSTFFANILNVIYAFSAYDLFAIYTIIITSIFSAITHLATSSHFWRWRWQEIKRPIFGKCSPCFLQLFSRLNKKWIPFSIFSIWYTFYRVSARLSLPNPKYWKRLEGAIGNSLLSRYICVPFCQHHTLFYCKKQWFLEHVYNYLLFVHLYVWCLEGGLLLLYTVSVQFSDLYKFEENNVILSSFLLSIEFHLSPYKGNHSKYILFGRQLLTKA